MQCPGAHKAGVDLSQLSDVSRDCCSRTARLIQRAHPPGNDEVSYFTAACIVLSWEIIPKTWLTLGSRLDTQDVITRSLDENFGRTRASGGAFVRGTEALRCPASMPDEH
jgi:hypothetical protein